MLSPYEAEANLPDRDAMSVASRLKCPKEIALLGRLPDPWKQITPLRMRDDLQEPLNEATEC